MGDAMITTQLTQAQQIRVECLKLVMNPARDAQTIIDRATALEVYVTGKEEAKKPAGKPGKDRQADGDGPI